MRSTTSFMSGNKATCWQGPCPARQGQPTISVVETCKVRVYAAHAIVRKLTFRSTAHFSFNPADSAAPAVALDLHSRRQLTFVSVSDALAEESATYVRANHHLEGQKLELEAQCVLMLERVQLLRLMLQDRGW